MYIYIHILISRLHLCVVPSLGVHPGQPREARQLYTYIN